MNWEELTVQYEHPSFGPMSLSYPQSPEEANILSNEKKKKKFVFNCQVMVE